MDSDDGGSIGTASTDTSLFLRELQALNTGGGGTGPISGNQSFDVSSVEITASADGGGDSETLPQALRTMIGSTRASGGRPVKVINMAENAESSVGVYHRDVVVYSAASSVPGGNVERSSGSNKVKTTTIVKHTWEQKFYDGEMVAVHRDADFVAYVLRGQSGGNVRVISRRTAGRVLLKVFHGNVLDIDFAFSDDVYLAAVDETGACFVHSFVTEDDFIKSQLLLHIVQEPLELELLEDNFRQLTRVKWCPYMPDEDFDPAENIDHAKMFVLTHGPNAVVWNVDMVAEEFPKGPVSGSMAKQGGAMVIKPLVKQNEMQQTVVMACLAPDGSAIGIAYDSGLVKFYLVDVESGVPDSMHEWTPHPNEPVSCLYFLDDLKPLVNNEANLWKYVLSGARHNTEIRIWSCETWLCLQCITFKPPLWQPDAKLRLKAAMDMSSHYFTLSDIDNAVLYVLQVHVDYTRATAHATSLTQFPLAQPCVSTAIFDAGVKKLRHSGNDENLDEITTGEVDGVEDSMEDPGGQGDVTTGVQVKMCSVHTKSLNELQIRYRPETSVPPVFSQSLSSMSQDETGYRDMLSDMSMEHGEASLIQTRLSQSTDTSQPVLITPQDFEQPSLPHPNGDFTPSATPLGMSEVYRSTGSSTSSFTQVTAMNEDRTAIDSPRSSLDPSSVMSPQSSFQQTPARPSPGVGVNSSLSDLPLPPVTSGEEDDLATPKSLHSSSRTDLNRSNEQILAELFSDMALSTPKTSGLAQSIESSSSTGSFQPGGTGRTMQSTLNQDRYDENDKEVAEALGETGVEVGGVTGSLDSVEDDTLEEVTSQRSEPQMSTGDKADMGWPEPPHVLKVDNTTNHSAQDEEIKEEIDVEDDEDDNEEVEVEEIITHTQTTNGNEGDDEADDASMPHRPPQIVVQADPVSLQALTSLGASVAGLAQQLQHQQDMMVKMAEQMAQQREMQLTLHRAQLEAQQLQQVSQQPSLQKDIGQLEDLLVSRMEHSLAQHMHRETQRLQDSLKKSDNQRRQRDEHMQQAVIADLNKAISSAVNNTLRSEMKQSVSPALHRFVEPMKDKIHQEVAQRLTAVDVLLKENIAKVVKSRATMDVLAQSMGDVIYGQMQLAYKDTFTVSFLPIFKQAMEKTVRDVNGVFQQGTKEYQLYLRQSAESMVRERAASEDIVRRMEVAQHQFLESVGHLKQVLLTSVREELSGQVAHAVQGVKNEIISEVQKIMVSEIHSALAEHGASINDKLTSYMRSNAPTPVSFTSEEESSKERIQRDLKAGRVNDAFQTALSASNLELVVYVCEAAAPLNIFSQEPIPLNQPVLLSLVSQLTADLKKNFDLKIKYLEEAVLNLDPEAPMTGEHIPTVLASLVQRLRTTDAHGGDPRKVKVVKRLTMAASSLL